MSDNLYKYLEREWAAALVERGAVRVGTLAGFRSNEHKPGISDPFEGRKRVVHTINRMLVHENGEIRAFDDRDIKFARMFGLIPDFPTPGQGPKLFDGVTLRQGIEAANCFLYCMSSVQSRETMEACGDADKCVEIFNPTYFLHYLAKALNDVRPVIWQECWQVSYLDRAETWNGVDWGTSPVVIKSKEFEKQHEVRAMWLPVDGKEIGLIDIEVPELTDYCRMIEIDK